MWRQWDSIYLATNDWSTAYILLDDYCWAIQLPLWIKETLYDFLSKRINGLLLVTSWGVT